MSSDNLNIDTGLFDVKAKYLTTISNEDFTTLSQHLTKIHVTDKGTFRAKLIGESLHSDAFAVLSKITECPISINRDTVWVQKNENYSDVLIITFDQQNKNGLVIIKEIGVYYISGQQHSWRNLQMFDLFVTVRKDNTLELDSLK